MLISGAFEMLLGAMLLGSALFAMGGVGADRLVDCRVPREPAYGAESCRILRSSTLDAVATAAVLQGVKVEDRSIRLEVIVPRITQRASGDLGDALAMGVGFALFCLYDLAFGRRLEKTM